MLAKIVGFIAYYTPVWIGYLIADIAGHVMYWRFLDYRRAVIDNLRHIYRGNVSEATLRRQARWIFRISARNFWDLSTVPHLTHPEIGNMIRVAEGSWDSLHETLGRGHGAILVTGHVGAFDFTGQYIIAGRFRPLVLTAPTVSPLFFAGVTYLRGSMGARIHVANPRALRRIVTALRNKEPVMMVADRNFSDSGSDVNFFGSPTRLPAGAVKLARETGAPIVPVFTYRENIRKRERRFVYYLGKPLWIEKTANRERDIARGMETMVKILERHIAMAPEQWVMFQRVWTPELKESSPHAAGQRVAQPDRDALTDSVAPAVGPLAQPPAEPER